MRPIHFPQQNALLAKDQVEYNVLPVFRGAIPHHPTQQGTERVISCYRLTEAELEQLCSSKVIWVQQLVGVDRGLLQPQMISVESPFVFETGNEWDGKGNEPENWRKVK